MQALVESIDSRCAAQADVKQRNESEEAPQKCCNCLKLAWAAHLSFLSYVLGRPGTTTTEARKHQAHKKYSKHVLYITRRGCHRGNEDGPFASAEQRSHSGRMPKGRATLEPSDEIQKRTNLQDDEHAPAGSCRPHGVARRSELVHACRSCESQLKYLGPQHANALHEAEWFVPRWRHTKHAVLWHAAPWDARDGQSRFSRVLA